MWTIHQFLQVKDEIKRRNPQLLFPFDLGAAAGLTPLEIARLRPGDLIPPAGNDPPFLRVTNEPVHRDRLRQAPLLETFDDTLPDHPPSETRLVECRYSHQLIRHIVHGIGLSYDRYTLRRIAGSAMRALFRDDAVMEWLGITKRKSLHNLCPEPFEPEAAELLLRGPRESQRYDLSPYARNTGTEEPTDATTA